MAETAVAAKSSSVEVVYRGIFQKTLANRICRGLVVAARKDGRVGTAFARYGDSPERNGVPAKNFAVVASDGDELEKSLAKYEPAIVDVSICVDDVMCKGIESWAWYGIQPINKLVREGGFLLVTSDRSPEELLQFTHQKSYDWTLAVIPSPKREGVFAPDGTASLAGLWVYNDDNTDYRCMAAVTRVAPEIVSIDAVEEYVREQTKDEDRVKQARDAYDNLRILAVKGGQGNAHFYEQYEKPGWTQMREGIIVEAMKVGTRNPVYKKWTARTRRPLIDFDKCIKCTLCWLHCPDECFEVTPDGTYEVVYEACIGCSICEEVCPVENCIKMVNELEFDHNDSLYEMSKADPDGYRKLLEKHGFPVAEGVK
ncbi:MAG TPA: 4Fe-4S dicluster-binding protein [Chloroflexota bacterium]|nr:4Fe-4S dicluster-binding protein [Chloroflexota bacterium]